MNVRGVAYRITPDGTIVETLYDGFGAGTVGRPMLGALEPGSVVKGLSFLRELNDQGVALGWELDIAGAQGVTRLTMGGVSDGDHFVVLGTADGRVEHFLSQITGVNNQLSTRLREALSDRADADELGQRLNDLTRLNNDLTNLHRELAQKSAELELLNRRKDEMLGMAAHDLRNPLGAIMGFAELLEARTADRLTEGELALVQHVGSSSRRMARLVDDLLDVSAIEAGQLRLDLDMHDVAQVVRDALALELPGAQRKDIALGTALPDSGVPAMIDPDKFSQVVNNLVSNAVKYSHSGTTVHVVLSEEPDLIELSVADQGQGIPADDLAGLFTPFGRADVRTTAGETSTGLGLAIVKNIVEGHGGRITVTSEVGVGSTFVVTIPRTARAT